MGRAGKQPFVKAGEKSRAHRGRPAAATKPWPRPPRRGTPRGARASLGPRPAPGRPGGEGKPSAPAGSSRAEREPGRALPRGLALGRGGRRGRVRERGPPGPLLGPPSPPLASALVERVEAAAEGRPGRGSPGGRARSKQPRGPESRGTAQGRGGVGAEPGGPARGAAPRLAGCHFVARPPFRAAGRAGAGRASPRRAGGRPRPLCSWPAGPRHARLGAEPGAAPASTSAPRPVRPLQVGVLSAPWRTVRAGNVSRRGAWNRAVGSCVWSSPQPRRRCAGKGGAAARALQGAPGPWALGRGSPELGRFKKKKI